jgi:hypothetical protein
MDEFRYVGATATDLDDGRPIAPGDFTGPIDVSAVVYVKDETTEEEIPHDNKNYHLLEDALLLKVESEQEKTERASQEDKEKKDREKAEKDKAGDGS